MHLIPEHLREHGTGYNARVKATPIFCMSNDVLIQCPHLMNAQFVPTDFDIALQAIFKETWRQFQKRGTCVGQMMKTALDMLNTRLAVFYPHVNKHVLLPDAPKEQLARFSVCAQYGAARVEVADQRGRWDGCAVSWIAEAVERVGALFRYQLELPEHHDANYAQQRELEPDEALAVEWANSREGVPAEYERNMNHVRDWFKFKCPPVTNIESLAFCMVNMISVGQGSNLIPTGRVNSRGVSDVEESGGHSTLFAGIRDAGGASFLSRSPKTWEFKYLNSWGLDWGDNGAVWISAAHAEAMLNQRDCYAVMDS
jgi:hypothetical protein